MTTSTHRKALATTVVLVLAAATLPPFAGALAAPDRAFALAVARDGAATGSADGPVPLDRLLSVMEVSCAGNPTQWCKDCAALAREFCRDCLSRSFDCAAGTVSSLAGYCKCAGECWGCTKVGVEAIDPSPPRFA